MAKHTVCMASSLAALPYSQNVPVILWLHATLQASWCHDRQPEKRLTSAAPCPERSCMLGALEGTSSAVDLADFGASAACPAAGAALGSSSPDACTGMML